MAQSTDVSPTAPATVAEFIAISGPFVNVPVSLLSQAAATLHVLGEKELADRLNCLLTRHYRI